MLLVAHLHFPTARKPSKKCKRATKPTHNKAIEKEPLPITRVLQKSGLSDKLNVCAFNPQKPFFICFFVF